MSEIEKLVLLQHRYGGIFLDKVEIMSNEVWVLADRDAQSLSVQASTLEQVIDVAYNEMMEKFGIGG